MHLLECSKPYYLSGRTTPCNKAVYGISAARGICQVDSRLKFTCRCTHQLMLALKPSQNSSRISWDSE